jgi:Fic family protein
MEFNLAVSPTTLTNISKADHLRGAWASGAAAPPDRLERMREAAELLSVGSACRLAGIRVTDAEVAAILSGQVTTFREAVEVAGYAATLRERFPEEPLVTPEQIQKLHAKLLVLPGTPIEPTPWRDQPNHLEGFDQEGRAIGRVFQTLPPRLIPEVVENLSTWLELGLKGKDDHPVLVVGAFVLALFHASPFSRGNVRVSCQLSVHLLRRAGYDFLPYGSLEREFEEQRVAFYDAFDASSTKLWSGEADLTPWLEFFSGCLARHAERVQAKVEVERRSLEFSPLQRAIVEAIREHGTAGAALLLTATGTNRNTLKDNLRRLVERGVLEQMGRRRGTQYRLATGEYPLARSEPETA